MVSTPLLCAAPNAERSHAGPLASDETRDVLPALAGAFGSAFHSSIRGLNSDYHHCLHRIIYPVSNCVMTDDLNLPRAQAFVLIGKVAGRERIVRERTNKSSPTATGKCAPAANPMFELLGPSAGGEAGGCWVKRFVRRLYSLV
jgi:hypothetical protein